MSNRWTTREGSKGGRRLSSGGEELVVSVERGLESQTMVGGKGGRAENNTVMILTRLNGDREKIKPSKSPFFSDKQIKNLPENFFRVRLNMLLEKDAFDGLSADEREDAAAWSELVPPIASKEEYVKTLRCLYPDVLKPTTLAPDYTESAHTGCKVSNPTKVSISLQRLVKEQKIQPGDYERVKFNALPLLENLDKEFQPIAKKTGKHSRL